jgi:hypothetical protein
MRPSSVTSLLLIAAVLLLASTSASAQCGGTGLGHANNNNAGFEFLLCFEQNATLADTDPGYDDIFLATAGDSAAEVTITCKAYPNFIKHISLASRGSFSYRISDDVNPVILTSEFVDTKAVHVQSTQAIICYGMNHKTFTADAFLALPKNTASTDYRVMAYTNTPGSGPGDETQSQFCVAAFSDGTDVTITPAGQTLGGSVAGKPLHFRLDSGTCVQIQGDPLRAKEDMTGSIVTSTKPVVVFGGHVCAEVPVSYIPPGQTSASCDHVCEMLPPTSSWGEFFVATNFAPRQVGDIVRVQALNDNTTVTIDGVQWGSVMTAGEYRDTLILQPIAIATSGPAQVGEFAHTAFDQSSTDGDPFFAIVPPVNQTYTDFTFFASQDPAYIIQNVIVVAEVSAKDRIVLDGTTLSAASFTDIATVLGGLHYSIATIAVTPGAHHITTTNDIQHAFTILSYGFGLFDSYGYTAGALLRPLRGAKITPDDHAGIVRSTVSRPSATISNIINTRVYLDSTRVEVLNSKKYVVKIEENLAMDVSHLEVGESTPIHFSVTPPNTESLHLRVQAFTHSGQWIDFEPSDAYMSIPPVSTNAVENSRANEVLAVYPNPAHDVETFFITMHERGDVQLVVYDDLGRTVQEVVNQEMAQGTYALKMETDRLSAGHYFYMLHSSKLGLNERGSIVVVR